MFDQLDTNDTSDTIANLAVAVILLIVCIGIPIGIAVLLGAGQTDPAATRVLTEQGYTHVKITGARWSGCGRGGLTITGFEADAPNTHKDVTGQVCTSFAGTHYIEVD